MASQIQFDNKVDKYYYSSQHLLGEGSYGKVVVGYDTENNSLVAVKCISLAKLRESNFKIKLLQREIDILQKINNQNIVKLYDVIQTEINIYMFLEYCQDGDLNQFLESNGNKIPLPQAMNFFKQIINGFQTLYTNDIIHRDIKPANIMLKNGQVLLSDFGFARYLEQNQMEQISNLTLLGTPLYSCPQILRGDKFSAKCDVWSVGVVGYQMIYGKVPWYGDIKEQLYAHIMKTPLKFPDQPSIPNKWKDLLTRMLQKEEEDRISWPEVFSHECLLEEKEQNITIINSASEVEDDNNNVKSINNNLNGKGMEEETINSNMNTSTSNNNYSYGSSSYSNNLTNNLLLLNNNNTNAINGNVVSGQGSLSVNSQLSDLDKNHADYQIDLIQQSQAQLINQSIQQQQLLIQQQQQLQYQQQQQQSQLQYYQQSQQIHQQQQSQQQWQSQLQNNNNNNPQQQ